MGRQADGSDKVILGKVGNLVGSEFQLVSQLVRGPPRRLILYCGGI